MNPQLKADLRPFKWMFLLVWGIFCFVISSLFLVPRDIPQTPQRVTTVEPLEWLYVQGDNVLVWPVVDGACQRQLAVAQYHRGEMVLVIARVGKWVEVESEDQTRLHTHGCISETMLGPVVKSLPPQ